MRILKYIKTLVPALILFTMGFSNAVKANENDKKLIVTLQSSTITLDPGGVQDSQSLFVSRQVNCQLVRNQGPRYVLDAAESIKYIDSLKIMLKINGKARFHDGSAITADDVLASFEYIKESRNIFKGFFTWINKIEAVDDKTIVFFLKKETPQFLKVLSSTNYTIFKKEFLEKAKKDADLWKNPLGCGGYQVASFNNNEIRLTPISTGMPIIFKLIKTNQIESKEIDQYDIVTIKVLGESEKLNDFQVLELLDPLQFYIGLNSKSNQWKDKYERCSFLAKIKTKSLLSSYGNNVIEANDLLPKGTLGYNEDENFNVKINNLSKKSHGKSNLNFKPFCVSYLTVSVQEKYINAYFDMFKEIYPNTFIKPIANVKKFGKNFVNDNCDAFIFALKSTYLDGYEYLTVFEDNDANFSGLYDKDLFQQISDSQHISSAQNRAKAYRKIIDKISDECIVKPIFTVPIRKIYMKNNLKAPGIGLVSIHQYFLGDIQKTDQL